MRAYIEMVRPILPELKNLKRVVSKKPRKDFTANQSCHGMITKYYDNKNHRIVLYTQYIRVDKIHPLVDLSIHNYSTIDQLSFLAHELAHLVHWDHTPYHKLLEAKILGLFMTKLHLEGYISEEDEGELSYYYPCKKGNLKNE